MKFIYVLRSELSDKAGLIINIVSTALVIFFVLLHFGSFYGTLRSMQVVDNYRIRIDPSSFSYEDLDIIKAAKGFAYAELHCSERVDTDDDTIPYISIISFIESPGRMFMPDGVPIEENDNPDYVYIPYDQKDLLGEIGDELILGINKDKDKGEARIFNRTPNDTEYDLYKLRIDGTFGTSMSSSICVSPSFFFEHFTPYCIYVDVDPVELTENEYNAVLSDFKEHFGAAESIHDFDTQYGMTLQTRRIQAVIFFIFGMISLIFLYSYTLSRKIRRFSVCRMCGASKKAIIFVIAQGCLLTFVIGFLIAVLGGKLLNFIIFEPAFGFNAFDLKVKDLFIFFVITLVIYLAVSFFYVRRFVRNPAIMVYRRSE